jgi:hypothetical protein
MSLLAPYGLSGPVGWSSPTGSVRGDPYTAHDDEKTTRETPASRRAARNAALRATLLSK